MEKRKSKIFIVLVSAAITFGTLFATIGPQRFHHMKHHCVEMKRDSENKDSQKNQ
jgi:hypothetical protein